MTHVLTDGLDNIVTYPYSIGLLRRDNPNVSFPAAPSNDVLAEWYVYPVTGVDAPTPDPINENVVENYPDLIDGVWVQNWSLVPATPEEVVARLLAYQQQAKSQADGMLSVGNTFVAEGLELSKKLSPEFEAYREALRYPELLPGYPVAPQFPEMPENIFAGPVDLSSDFEASLS